MLHVYFKNITVLLFSVWRPWPWEHLQREARGEVRGLRALGAQAQDLSVFIILLPGSTSVKVISPIGMYVVHTMLHSRIAFRTPLICYGTVLQNWVASVARTLPSPHVRRSRRSRTYAVPASASVTYKRQKLGKPHILSFGTLLTAMLHRIRGEVFGEDSWICFLVITPTELPKTI